VLIVSVLGASGASAASAIGLAAATVFAARRGTRRIVVEGRSMTPAFEPGDRLLVLRLPRAWPLKPGDVVALADPRAPDRLLVKRVATTDGAQVTVTGDNAAESTDSNSFGPVERSGIWGLVVYRYAPAGRTGGIGRWGFRYRPV
jgi:nickel-type superoxide dismutase maturation protease